MTISLAHKHFDPLPMPNRAFGCRPGSLWCLLSLVLLAIPLRASLIVGLPSPIPPALDEGQVLLDQLHCTVCHLPPNSALGRFQPSKSPRLQSIGSRVSAQFLRAYLLHPPSEKPGTTMPDLLHGLAPHERTNIVDDLVHYLSSLRDSAPEQAAGSSPFKMTQGRSLYHQIGCVACHAPQDATGSLPASFISIPLGFPARKYSVAQLTAFLLDPLQSRPTGRMPSFKLSPSEASSIAMYLLRDQTNAPPDSAPAIIPGLAFEYFEAGVHHTDQLETLKPVQTGFIDQFAISPKLRSENIGFRFSGLVHLPSDGAYTFYTASDDGTKLFIGDRLVVDNDGTHATTEKKGSLILTAGYHPIMLLWFNAGGPAELKVSLEGPGIKKQPVPSNALFFSGRAMHPLDQEIVLVDEAKASRGRAHFDSLGCAACHETGPGPLPAKPLKTFKSLDQLDPKSGQGCLSSAPGRGVPKFDFSDRQRRLLRAALTDPAKFSGPLDSQGQILKTMAAMNCYACHSRDGFGGPDSARNGFFTTAGQQDLGDEGRIPPHLTGVGAKLRPEWLRTVLLEPTSVRPYMATRMPSFGPTNLLSLLRAFLEADASSLARSPEPTPTSDIKYGRALVGSGGLSCISCHTFGPYASLGVPAMDLTLMTKRLTEDWFHRYLLDPPSLRPGTRMPQFWPDGKSLRQDLLNGDTHRQINAIWAYLSKAGEAGIPPGLIQGQMELVAEREAVIYRAFIQQSGTRGIGVAFPEKANLVFDANELRPTFIWQGPFLDVAKHRTGRGEGTIGPLGYNVLPMPQGSPLAFLADAAQPWPSQSGKMAGYKMLGYQLDRARRPTFKYSFHQIQVNDAMVAVAGELEPSLRRTMTFMGTLDNPTQPLWFRAWSGQSIETQSDGSFLAEGKVMLKFGIDPLQQPVLRQSAGLTELIIPLKIHQGQATVVEDIFW